MGFSYYQPSLMIGESGNREIGESGNRGIGESGDLGEPADDELHGLVQRRGTEDDERGHAQAGGHEGHQAGTGRRFD